MVILTIKRGEDFNTFRFEALTSDSADKVIVDVTELFNLRIKVLLLSGAVRELAKFGPLRPEGQKGLSEDVSNIPSDEYHKYGPPTNPDPTCFRYGVPPSAQSVRDMMVKTADEAEAAVSHKLVDLRENLSMEKVAEQYELLKGALAIAYPANHNLPEWDPAREIIDGHIEDIRPKDFLKIEDASLWWAGKEIRRDKQMWEIIGKNEKTTIICKLQSRGAGAPSREARIDEDTHRAMLSFYHKKEQESKQLAEDEDDSYLSSAWANPNSLKSSLHGGTSIRWR